MVQKVQKISKYIAKINKEPRSSHDLWPGQHAGDGGGHAVQQGGAAGAHAALPGLSQRRRARPAATSQEHGGPKPARLRLASQQGLDEVSA